MCLRPKRLQARAKAWSDSRSIIGHHTLDLHAEAGIVSDGCLEEGNGALLSLVLHHTAEGEPGIIVDADVDEFPADAEVTADDTSPPSGDAMPNGADPA